MLQNLSSPHQQGIVVACLCLAVAAINPQGLRAEPLASARLRGHSDSVTSVAFSPGGKTLASGSQDRTIKIWEEATGEERITLRGHSKGVTAVAFSPDGKTLASASEDQTVKLWDVTSGENTATLQGHTDQVTSVAFSPDGKTLASGSLDGTI